jgi:hypothetical protein
MRRLEEIKLKISLSKNEKAIRSTGLRFQAWCHARQCGSPAYPVTITHLCAFIVARCDDCKGSSKSLRKWISHIKTYSGQQRLPWLDDLELKDLNKVVEHLEFLDTTPTRRARPLVHELIYDICDSSDVDELSKVMITVGHDSLQRGAELCSGVLVSDHLWSYDRREVSIMLGRTKTHRRGGAEPITIRDYGRQSGARHLRKHFDKFNLWTSPNTIVYPRPLRSSALDWSKSISTASLRRRIKKAVKAIDVDPAYFGTHSLRAGGATDLFRANVFYPNIKKFGRWKSDIALIYYRDEDAISKAACQGFALLTNKFAKTKSSHKRSFSTIANREGGVFD